SEHINFPTLQKIVSNLTYAHRLAVHSLITTNISDNISPGSGLNRKGKAIKGTEGPKDIFGPGFFIISKGRDHGKKGPYNKQKSGIKSFSLFHSLAICLSVYFHSLKN